MFRVTALWMLSTCTANITGPSLAVNIEIGKLLNIYSINTLSSSSLLGSLIQSDISWTHGHRIRIWLCLSVYGRSWIHRHGRIHWDRTHKCLLVFRGDERWDGWLGHLLLEDASCQLLYHISFFFCCITMQSMVSIPLHEKGITFFKLLQRRLSAVAQVPQLIKC